MPQSPNASENVLAMLAGLIHDQTGLMFEPARYDFLLDKVSPLAAERSCPTLLDYYYILKYDEKAEEEWLRLQTALAVNETYFWREFDQIRSVVDVIVPKLQKERPELPVRIWHAACATGEEPYTMAIALQEAGRYLYGKIQIYATDFNQTALAQAREGVYRQRSFRSIPADVKERYFIPLRGQHSGEHAADRFRLIDSIRERVDFAYLNLLDENSMAGVGGYDIIMCRNAFIYFSDSAVRRVVDHFYQAINDAGYLFVASAESLLRVTNRFALMEIGGAFGYLKLPLLNGKQIIPTRRNGA